MKPRVYLVLVLCVGAFVQPLRGQQKESFGLIDSTRAISIALKAGLKQGIEPAYVHFYDKDTTARFWLVSVTLERNGNMERGQRFRIDAITGEVIENAIWTRGPSVKTLKVK